MTTTALTLVGEGLGVQLPAATLRRLKVSEGDQLVLIDTPNGVELTALNPRVAEQLAVAREVIADNREALRELAK